MSKAVLISIQPKWCDMIADGKKTVEVRKTKPKLDVPFKVYIYCTMGKSPKDILTFANYDKGEYVGDYLANGKVIGEFVCDRVYKIYQCNSGWVQEYGCISREEFFDYLGLPYNSHFDAKGAFAWHISNLVIYDKPRELGEFFLACDKPNGTDCSVCLDRRENRCKTITRPPQSWCYVEEV